MFVSNMIDAESNLNILNITMVKSIVGSIRFTILFFSSKHDAIILH